MMGREIIGPPDCPILYRWTLIKAGKQPVPAELRDEYGPETASMKLLLHHFPANADDRDVHDHPRPFWTLVLRGWYDDMKPCQHCAGGLTGVCRVCWGAGVVLNERMRPGMLRRRPATHCHRAKAGPDGCWTLVLMGPLRRQWGFWRRLSWWAYKDYEAEFGYAMRCDDLDKEYRK